VVDAGAAVALVVGRCGESNENRFLSELTEAGFNEWATERAAIHAGYVVCEQLDLGRPTRGSERDKIAVRHLCPAYLDAFRVLATANITGTFSVVSDSFSGSSTGRSCRPDGGYGDINTSTQVIVKNSAGNELARTSLGSGVIEGFRRCTFTFQLNLTEGETIYILSVGNRGEVDYTWDEISQPGRVALVLGD